jgi:hypothetical protein
MEQNETKKLLKVAQKYFCEHCYYSTSKKSSFDKHIATDKHKKRENETFETKMKQNSFKKCQCLCGSEFGSRTTLWRHRKSCNADNLQLENVVLDKHNDKLYNNHDVAPELIKLITELVKGQNGLQESILELCKNGTHNTTTNSHNKTFNLQVFLNETCKDAMNIMEFVDSIKLQLSDLENVGKIGYVQGISDIITTNLKALDVTQRPIHCTDKKRETIYIKDENKWEKEDDQKKKLRKAIRRVATKNQMLLLKFREVHPDCIKSTSKYSDQYSKIIIESMGGSGDNDIEKEDKIIKHITNVTTIDK